MRDLIKRYLHEYEKDFSLNSIIKYYKIEEKENIDEFIANNLLKSFFGEGIFETLEDNDEIMQLGTKGDYQIDTQSRK